MKTHNPNSYKDALVKRLREEAAAAASHLGGVHYTGELAVVVSGILELARLCNEAADALASPLPEGDRVPLAPNVDGQDFYELCQQYRHSREMSPHPDLPNTVQAFNNLREYIKHGWLPWPSYERSPATHNDGG